MLPESHQMLPRARSRSVSPHPAHGPGDFARVVPQPGTPFPTFAGCLRLAQRAPPQGAFREAPLPGAAASLPPALPHPVSTTVMRQLSHYLSGSTLPRHRGPAVHPAHGRVPRAGAGAERGVPLGALLAGPAERGTAGGDTGDSEACEGRRGCVCRSGCHGPRPSALPRRRRPPSLTSLASHWPVSVLRSLAQHTGASVSVWGSDGWTTRESSF